MGTAAAARIALAALAWAALAAPARAAPDCTGTTGAGERFATCFDLGNRLHLTATSAGYGGAAELRHVIGFEDEPDLVWKLEHDLLAASADWPADHFEGVLYSGRYLRHARDGHLVLPLGVPRKVFLPFDVGAEAALGRVEGRFGGESLELGIIRAGGLVELARAPNFRRRLALGAVARWDVELDRRPLSISHHRVAPLSMAALDARAESASGLTAGELRVEGGAAWSGEEGWGLSVSARAAAERVLIAINDRPLSLFASARYRSRPDELRAEVGLRFALVQKRHDRVNLAPLSAR